MEKRGVVEPGRTPDMDKCCGGGCRSKQAAKETPQQASVRLAESDFTKKAADAVVGELASPKK